MAVVSSQWEGAARCERVSAHRGAKEQDGVKEGGEQKAEAPLKFLGGGEHEGSTPGGEATASLGSWVWASEVTPVPSNQEERRAGVLGLNTSWKHVSTEVRDYVRRQEAQLERTLGLLHVLLSCTFLLVLHS